uniref:S26 family signal peptidase n=1 Tax=Edaphosphingomonas laterariae TaxID=861865 RepID=UPI001FE88316|nr:S26 family signal peptidase [Sphingomonas laterariae]
MLLTLPVAATVFTLFQPPTPRLLWNASESMTPGLYWIKPGINPRRDDLVLARPPGHIRPLLARRHYLAPNVPLLKRAAAVPGDTVCALGQEIFINARWVAERRPADPSGRPMPDWTGCLTMREGAVFLLGDHPLSFDGRYFGPSPAKDIIGQAALLWPLR